MNRKKDPVREELARAGEASQITPSLRKLDGCRIMTDTDVPEEDFLMRFNGKACFPRRDLTAITGQEKCGIRQGVRPGRGETCGLYDVEQRRSGRGHLPSFVTPSLYRPTPL